MSHIVSFFCFWFDISDKRINKKIIRIPMKRKQIMNLPKIDSLFNIIQKLKFKIIVIIMIF